MSRPCCFHMAPCSEKIYTRLWHNTSGRVIFSYLTSILLPPKCLRDACQKWLQRSVFLGFHLDKLGEMKMNCSSCGIIEYFRVNPRAGPLSLAKVCFHGNRDCSSLLFAPLSPVQGLINHYSSGKCVFKCGHWLIFTSEEDTQTSQIHRLTTWRFHLFDIPNLKTSFCLCHSSSSRCVTCLFTVGTVKHYHPQNK